MPELDLCLSFAFKYDKPIGDERRQGDSMTIGIAIRGFILATSILLVSGCNMADSQQAEPAEIETRTTVPAEPDQERTATPRIVSERFAKLKDWPFFATIGGEHPHPRSDAPFFYCGASFIHEDWVLTAAHCVIHSEEDDFTETWTHTDPAQNSEGDWEHSTYGKFVVVTNTDDLANEIQSVAFSVREIIVHPDYRPGDKYNVPLSDLALLKLDRSWDGETVELVGNTQSAARRGFIAGFGSTGEFAQAEAFEMDPSGRLAYAGSQFLKYVALPVVSQDRCKAVYAQHDPNIHLCAGYDRGGVDSCQGDSGGPFVYRTSAKAFQLAGIVSFGRGCARAIADQGGYGVYANVATQLDWIDSVIDGAETSDAPLETPTDAVFAAISDLTDTLSSSRSAGMSASLNIDLPQTEFAFGDRLELEFSSPIDGRLLMLIVDVEGNTIQLFPNTLFEQTSSLIEAGKTYQFPAGMMQGEIMAGPPAGKETLIMLVVPDDFKLDASIGLKILGANDELGERLLDESVFSIYSLVNEVIAVSRGEKAAGEDLADFAWSIIDVEIVAETSDILVD